MSVLIKGMKLPENCYDCDFCRAYDEPNQGYFCVPTFADLHRIDFTKERANNCPLVEVEGKKIGTWIDFDEEIPEGVPLYDFVKDFPQRRCSVCGYQYISVDKDDKPHNFCSNCGSEMITKEEN